MSEDSKEFLTRLIASAKKIQENLTKRKDHSCEKCKEHNEQLEKLNSIFLLIIKEQKKENDILEKLLDESINAIEKIYPNEEDGEGQKH